MRNADAVVVVVVVVSLAEEFRTETSKIWAEKPMLRGLDFMLFGVFSAWFTSFAVDTVRDRWRQSRHGYRSSVGSSAGDAEKEGREQREEARREKSDEARRRESKGA